MGFIQAASSLFNFLLAAHGMGRSSRQDSSAIWLVFFTLAVYAIIGVATRTAHISEDHVAGRRVPAFDNGMATGADWMSAASFVGMAGSLFLLGYDGIAGARLDRRLRAGVDPVGPDP